MTETSSQDVGAVWGGVSGEKTGGHAQVVPVKRGTEHRVRASEQEPQTCRIAATCSRCTVQEKPRRKR